VTDADIAQVEQVTSARFSPVFTDQDSVSSVEISLEQRTIVQNDDGTTTVTLVCLFITILEDGSVLGTAEAIGVLEDAARDPGYLQAVQALPGAFGQTASLAVEGELTASPTMSPAPTTTHVVQCQ